MANSIPGLTNQQRKIGVDIRTKVNWEWFIEKVSNEISLTLHRRVVIATAMIFSKVVQNINVPVVRVGKVVTVRSKPGEFPRTDLTHLKKDIFQITHRSSKYSSVGIIGTTLDYGFILETNQKLKRSFLKRTLDENRAEVNKILTGPIK